MDHLFLGIDGGGTNCRARLADADGTILGEGKGGPANTRLGLDVAFGSIIAATDIALASAGLSLDRKKDIHAGFGLAGLSLERERNLVKAYAHPFASITVESDAYIACLGAHNGRDGGVLILGTGSCGCTLIDGVEHTVGGWGFEISDHGSGAHLGYEAVRGSLLAFEGAYEMGGLAKEIMAELGNSPETAVPWAEKARPADYGKFAPIIVKWAESGDALAHNILAKGAADAALLLRAMEKQGAERIALIGGVAEPLEKWLSDEVGHLLVEAESDALNGAILLAKMNFERGE